MTEVTLDFDKLREGVETGDVTLENLYLLIDYCEYCEAQNEDQAETIDSLINYIEIAFPAVAEGITETPTPTAAVGESTNFTVEGPEVWMKM